LTASECGGTIAPPTMKSDARAVPIDLLRILAASCIFYVHAGLFINLPLYLWGDCAVATFIYLTAFCTVRYSKQASGRLVPYWMSRFKTIYPTFAVICVIIFAASFVFKPAKMASHYSAADLVLNLLLIADYVGRPWLTEPMWFIPFVLQVYLILPFLVKIPVRWHFLPLSFIISAAACAVVYTLVPTDLYRAYSICRDWSPLFRLPEVLIGCLVGRALVASAAAVPILVYAGCCALALGLTTSLHSPAAPFALLYCKDVIVFVVLAALVFAIRPFIPANWAGTIGLLGKASFPFFLLHGTGMSIVSRKFGPGLAAWLAYFVLCWLVSIVFVASESMIKNLAARK
jgi:peptidoglycan/LPS O-acetylase OafA/YrhL